jgi:transposase
MDFKVFIGVDVSKDTLDFVPTLEGKALFHEQTKNDNKGINQFYKRLSKTVDARPDQWLFIMEYTGVYCNPMLEFAIRKELPVWMESAAKIKVYHALERGKNDALDALRIAEYAFAKKDKIKLWKAPRKIMIRLKFLIKLRERLITSKKRLMDPLREDKQFCDKGWVREHEKFLKPIMAKIEKQIKGVEQEIQHLINEDENLKKLYGLISSVSGVGQIVTINTLVVTNEFKQITDPRQMACNCGVVPFKYDSGTSVRSKARVSHRANKSMKVLFHLAAMSAISTKGELQDYYQRKVDEGKNKMAVINAVRNKIIHRIFACVRDQRKYEKNYTHSLV